jgi:hypothetical protein
MRVKKSQPMTRLVSNDGGQAMIEYVLLLTLSIMLVLLIFYRIFSPLQDFVKAYMGDYVACLLDTGELPTLGGTSTIVSDQGCPAKFNPGADKTKQLKPYQSTGTGGTSPDNSNYVYRSSSSSSSGSSSGGTYAGSASRKSGSSFLSGTKAAPGAEASIPNSKVTTVPFNEGNGFFRFGNSSFALNRTSKKTTVPMSMMSDDQRKKLEKNAGLRPKSRTVANDFEGHRNKKMLVKGPPPKTQEMADDEPFTIGNFIRILFIVAIILALFVFVGGQALQMSKSGEK